MSIQYTEGLAESGIEPWAGGRSDSYDDALAGPITGLYKAEWIHRRAPWKSRGSMELATLQWVQWFKHIRRLEPIGHNLPAQAEAKYWK